MACESQLCYAYNVDKKTAGATDKGKTEPAINHKQGHKYDDIAKYDHFICCQHDVSIEDNVRYHGDIAYRGCCFVF